MVRIKVKDYLNNFLNNLRKKRGYNYSNSGRTNFYRKQFNRLIVCIVIILTVLLIKKINIKLTNNVIRIVDESINYSFDIKKDTNKLVEFMKDTVKIPDNIIEVFSTDVFR